jgi:hypothetical protein
MTWKICGRQQSWLNFKVLAHHLHRGTLENHDKSQPRPQTKGDSKRWAWSNSGMMISRGKKKETWEDTCSNGNSSSKNLTWNHLRFLSELLIICPWYMCGNLPQSDGRPDSFSHSQTDKQSPWSNRHRVANAGSIYTLQLAAWLPVQPQALANQHPQLQLHLQLARTEPSGNGIKGGLPAG